MTVQRVPLCDQFLPKPPTTETVTLELGNHWLGVLIPNKDSLVLIQLKPYDTNLRYIDILHYNIYNVEIIRGPTGFIVFIVPTFYPKFYSLILMTHDSNTNRTNLDRMRFPEAPRE